MEDTSAPAKNSRPGWWSGERMSRPSGWWEKHQAYLPVLVGTGWGSLPSASTAACGLR